MCKKKDFTCIFDVSWCSEIPKTDFLMTWLILFPYMYFLVLKLISRYIKFLEYVLMHINRIKQ